MNEQFVFNLNSIVVDDIASGEVYETLGAPMVWEGRHPFFNTPCAVYATAKGGAMLLEASSNAHSAIGRCARTKERHFHVNLLVSDLAAQRAVAEASSYIGELSSDYAGPFGKSFAAGLKISGGNEFWFEFTEGHENLIGREDSAFTFVDSTAMVAPKRDVLLDPFASLGLVTDNRANDAYFDVLDGINAVVMLQDWHYLEVNEPTRSEGVMNNFLARSGGPSIFGTNFVPRDMAAFVETAKQNAISINTESPIRLKVSISETQYECADIVTINPRATGGARIFVLSPLEYPWDLVM